MGSSGNSQLLLRLMGTLTPVLNTVDVYLGEHEELER